MRTFLRSFAAFSLFSTLVPSTSHAVIEEDALTLWYTFDSIENGTTVPDRTANGLDAMIGGDPVLVDSPFGKSMEFDGDADRLSLSYIEILDLPEYTLSIWMKPQKGNDGYVGVFGRGGRHYAFWMRDGNTDTWRVHNRFRDGGNGNDGAPDAGALSHGDWLLVTLTKDMEYGSTYVNGEFLSSATVDNPYYVDRTTLYVGADPGRGDRQYYVGEMDDVRLYSKALTAQQIEYLYNDGNGDWNELPTITLNSVDSLSLPLGTNFTDPGAVASDPEDGDLTPQVTISPPTGVGLPAVAWWKFDDDATDATSGGNDATEVGQVTYDVGKFGKAIALDSTDGTSDRVEVPGFSAFSGNEAISISAWVNIVSLGTDDATGDGAIFTTQNANPTMFWINFDSDPDTQKPPGERTSLSMNVGNTGGNNRLNAPGGLLSPGSWHHLVGVMEKGSRKVYIDGVLQATLTNAAELVHSSEGEDVWIGGWSGATNMDFDGMIDDVRVYDHALSEEKIARLHTWDGVEDLEVTPTEVDTNVLGEWVITYTFEDSHGYRVSAERTVDVTDPLAPELTLVGEEHVEIEIGGTYSELSAIAKDANGDEITDPNIQISGDVVDTNVTGTYTILYDFIDDNSRAAETITRTVQVGDFTAPVITIIGEEIVQHPLGRPYQDLGATAEDAMDGEIAPLSSLYEWNKLSIKGFANGRDDAGLDFSGNGGYLQETPDGQSTWEDMLYIQTDAHIHDTNTGILPTQADNYHVLFEGVFRAPVGGSYRFGLEWPNERGSFFLDSDRDGIFETEGAKGIEWINRGLRYGYSFVDLEPGIYKVALGVSEGGGDPGLRPRFQTPNTASPSFLTEIDPSHVAQENLWGMEVPIDTSVPGSHTITYTAIDQSGNEATATRTVIVAEIVNPPVLTLNGRPILKHPLEEDYVEQGVTLKDADGNLLPQEELDKVLVVGEVDKDVIGEYTLTYHYTDTAGRPAEPGKRVVFVVDLAPPVIALIGEDTVTHVAGQVFVDPGLTVTDNIDPDPIWGSTANIPSENLFLHLDASAIPGVKDGDLILEWKDLSGNGHHMSDTRGAPEWVSSAINTEPALYFDGGDYMAALEEVQREYSVYTVSRLEGTQNQRLISSRNVNWFIGYWGNSEDVYHPEGFATGTWQAATSDPHLYTAISSGSNHVNFYADGEDVTSNNQLNGRIGKLQFGGYNATSEPSKGYVAEVLLYDIEHGPTEKLSIETYLASKYHFFGVPEYPRPLLNVPGEYTILYSALDAAGNRSFATRTLVVTPDPTLPVIELVGGIEYHQEAGMPFVDPGANLVDSEGNALVGDITVGGDTVDVNNPGVYFVTYDHKTVDDRDSIQVTRAVSVEDTTGPVISLSGESVIQIAPGTEFTDPGASALDFEGVKNVSKQHDIPVIDWIPGLELGRIDAFNDTTTPNPRDQGVDPIGPSYAEIRSAADPWGTNRTFVYSGQLYDEDGNVTIMGDIDDRFSVEINQQVVLSGSGWGASRAKQLSLGAGDEGWHDFELRISNGGGPGGLARTIGFGIDKTGQTPDDDDGNVDVTPFEVARNLDEFTMDLFRVMGPDYNQFDTSVPGTYIITYTASDSKGHISTRDRTLIIREDTSKPYFVLYGDVNSTLQAHPSSIYEDPKAKVLASDGQTVLLDNVVGAGSVDLSTPGVYTLTYDYEDGDGNFIEPGIRTVAVVDQEPPAISLIGKDYMILHTGTEFVDPGVTAIDLIDGVLNTWSSLEQVPGHLQHRAYLLPNTTETYLDFEHPECVFYQPAAGIAYVGDGPANRGLYYFNDADFMTHPSINQVDDFQNFFYGNFHAPTDGNYTFEGAHADDGSATWLDRDGDGQLSQVGLLGSERITWGNHSNTIYLAKGDYSIYFGHREGGGSSSASFWITLPDGVKETVHPTRQNGLWSAPALDPPDTSKPGLHKIFYFARDGSGNWSYASRIVEVIDNPNQPNITLLGDVLVNHEAGTAYEDAGVLLETAQGAPIEDAVEVENLPDGFTVGSFEVIYRYTDGDGNKAVPVVRTVQVVDTLSPSISLAGANPANHSLNTPYADPGATAMDSLEGNIPYVTSMSMPSEGLVLYLDAAFFKGTLSDGDVIDISWDDLSGEGNHADNQSGDPTWVESGSNGQPTVNFDGDDMIWTTTNFEPDLDHYTIFTVARYTTNTNRGRVISSRTRNWLFGFHNNGIRRFHSDGWLYNSGPVDTNFHVHVGDVNDGDEANFWVDNIRYVTNGTGLNDTRYKPREIQLGGYGTSSELSKCEVSEVLLYNRVLSSLERTAIISHLHSKYDVRGTDIEFQFTELDTSTIGERILTYFSADNSGNLVTATRTIHVVDPTDLPVIVLNGDADVTVDSGTSYVEAGATIQGDPAANPTVHNPVNINVPGTYKVNYDYTDGQGRAAITVSRTVHVLDKTPPVISLTGGETYVHTLGNAWVEPGVSALDNADGAIDVTDSILSLNHINRRGFMIDNQTETLLNLDGNHGLLALPYIEEARLEGPLRFINDADFMDADPKRSHDVGITRQDQYQNLFLAYFHCKVDGAQYVFGMGGPDDRSTIWIDLDQDGVFELEGDLGQEIVTTSNYYGYRKFDLNKGFYKFAITHLEYGGGARIEPRVRAIVGPGPTNAAIIDPTDPLQDGMWVQYNPVDVFAPGEYQITYTATDSGGNTSEVVRTVIVQTNPDAPIIELAGDEKVTLNYGDPYFDAGYSVKDVDGNPLDAEGVTVSAEVNSSKLGLQKLHYNFSHNSISARTQTRTILVVDNAPPEISMMGDAEIDVFQATEYIDPGATATDNYDGVIEVSSSEIFPSGGLQLHLDASSIPALQTGDTVSEWKDVSGNDHHFVKTKSNPIYMESGLNGQAAVYLDGNSLLTSTEEYGNKYTLISVSRADNLTWGRLISSQDQNYIYGYYNWWGRAQVSDVFHPGAWATNFDHFNTGRINLYTALSTGNNYVSFIANGKDVTTWNQRNGSIGYLQFGGYQSGSEMASGYIGEVLLYDRLLNGTERQGINARLTAKYKLDDSIPEDVQVPVNTQELGTYHVVYRVPDSKGNIGVAIRTVNVVPNPDAPTITLLGEETIHLEAGTPFVDLGHTLKENGQDLDSNLVTITGDVDENTPGTYELVYSYKPYRKAHAADVTRYILVRDTVAPVITLVGDSVVRLKVGDPYIEDGASSTDSLEGDIHVYNNYSYKWNVLKVDGYLVTSRDEILMEYDNNGGLLAEISDDHAEFAGKISELSGDDFFRDLFVPRLPKGDDFQVNFHGVFSAHQDGFYTFGVGAVDDRACFFIDLDQDGIFERNGDAGDERMTTDYRSGSTTVNLNSGVYQVAIGFMEFSGNSYFTPTVRFPDQNLSLAVDTLDPQQAGVWGIPITPVVDTSTVGEYTIEYSSVDSSGNEASVFRTIQVVEDTSIPFIALKGEAEMTHEFGSAFVDPRARVIDSSGVEVNSDLKSNDSPDVNLLGENILTYSFGTAENVTRKVVVIDTTPPEITLLGDNPHVKTVGDLLEDPGISMTDLADPNPHFTTSQLHVPNQLDVYGFNFNPNLDSYLDFNNNGGLLTEDPDGMNVFTNGPNGDGMNFQIENDFHRLFAGIEGRDHFQLYFTGYFYARLDGDYTFEIQDRDDRTSIWLDLDKDGVYSRNGFNGDERMVWNTQSTTITLSKGFYQIIIGFSEYTGGARMKALFQTPEGAGPSELTVIQPGAPDQKGLWFSHGTGVIDTQKPGEYEVTYYSLDASGNYSSISRNIVIEIDQTAPLMTLLGDDYMIHEAATPFTDPGVQLTKADSTPITDDPVKTVTLDGQPVSDLDPAIPGEYHIVYTYMDGNSKSAIPVERTVLVQDTIPPVILIDGPATLTVIPNSLYEDAGATAQDDLDGEVIVTQISSNPLTRIVPGLIGGQYPNWDHFKANPGDLGVHPLGPEEAQNRSTAFPWNGNVTVIYTGEFYDEDGVFSFYEAIDEWAFLKIGDTLLFDDRDYNREESATVDLGSGGWFPFELRMRNTGGAGGAKILGEGLVFDPNGGQDWIVPQNSDADTADLFRTIAPLHDTVDTSSEGTYTVTYTATDAAGNISTATRTVIVKDDPTLPILTLEGNVSIIHEAGEPFVDPGATAADRKGNALSGDITITGTVDHTQLGTYTIYYDYTTPDGTKSAPRVRRDVEVVDTTAPVITLNEGEHFRVAIDAPWADPGFTATDNLDNSLDVIVSQVSNVSHMVAHWTFEDGSGGALSDSINGINGTLVDFDDNDLAWVDGKYGKALQFDGNKSHVLIPHDDRLDTSEYTISAWIYSEEYVQNAFIFEKTTNGTNNSHFSIWLDQQADELYFRNIDDNANILNTTITASDVFVNSTWHHITVSNNGEEQSLYVDGEVVQVGSHSFSPPLYSPNGTTFIGSAADIGVDFFFEGKIDEIRYLNKAIPEEDIPLLMEPGGINTTKKTTTPYVITYSTTDSSGNFISVERNVYVSDDSTPPVITLVGEPVVNVSIGAVYQDAGVTATDDIDESPVLQLRLEVGGLDEVDTSTPGEYIITYDVADLSGNNAEQVSRKVIVGNVADPFQVWIVSTPLKDLDAALQDLEADPDQDGVKNIIEYALGTQPTVADSSNVFSIPETDSGNLIITYYRLKSTEDPSLTIKAQLSSDLGEPDSWDENAVTETLDPVQTGLPSAQYEKVQVRANVAVDSEVSGKQFIRIMVTR